MRTSAWIVLALALVPSAAACSTGSAASDGGSDDASVSDATDDGLPAICAAFTEAGAPCPQVSPVRCFACGDASGGCYCQATPQGPRWSCVSDPSCLPCTLGDENCAPATGDDGGPAEAGDDGGTADGGTADASEAGSDAPSE